MPSPYPSRRRDQSRTPLLQRLSPPHRTTSPSDSLSTRRDFAFRLYPPPPSRTWAVEEGLSCFTRPSLRAPPYPRTSCGSPVTSVPQSVAFARHIGSATLPFGSYLTGLQRFTPVGPAALLPLHGRTPRLRLSMLRSDVSDLSAAGACYTAHPACPTVTGLSPAGLVQHPEPHAGPPFRRRDMGHSGFWRAAISDRRDVREELTVAIVKQEVCPPLLRHPERDRAAVGWAYGSNTRRSTSRS